MAGTDISIECLPEWILGEIFSYLRDKTVLRLVSKNFKHIVDDSQKLMSNYWLKIKAEELNDSNNVVNCFYQNIYIDCDNRNSLEIINKYKWSKHVKSIKLRVPERFLLSFGLLQSALFSYDNLQEIAIDVLCDDLKFEPKSILKKPTFKSLKKLSVDNDVSGRSSKVLDLFTDSPNLKKLTIRGYRFDFTSLIDEAVWKLEELELFGFVDSVEKFLEKQGSTLKVLKCSWLTLKWNSDKISRKLPNLEILHLETCVNDEVNSETLIPNNTLKILSCYNGPMDFRALKGFLLHYNNIERLYIDRATDIEFNNLELSNLKHISATPDSSKLLWRLKMENLKSLTYLGESIDLDVLNQMPAHNLKNVETLKVINGYVSAILGFFPALKHLFLLSENIDITDDFLDGILAESDLKSISIIESCWQLEKTPQEYLSSVNNEKLVIKLYSQIIDMTGQEMEIEYIKFEEKIVGFRLYDGLGYIDD